MEGEPTASDRWVMLVLMVLGLCVSFGLCLLAHLHTEARMELFAQFGADLPLMTRIYAKASGPALVLPFAATIATLVVTQAGRHRRPLGMVLIVAAILLATTWIGGAYLAMELPVRGLSK